MNRVMFLLKDGTMNLYEDVQPFQNNVGQMLFEQIEFVQTFIIQVGIKIKLHPGSDLLEESNERHILEGITSFNFNDDEDTVKYKVLIYDILKQYFKLQNLV